MECAFFEIDKIVEMHNSRMVVVVVADIDTGDDGGVVVVVVVVVAEEALNHNHQSIVMGDEEENCGCYVGDCGYYHETDGGKQRVSCYDCDLVIFSKGQDCWTFV